jgi:hypothetical protein
VLVRRYERKLIRVLTVGPRTGTGPGPAQKRSGVYGSTVDTAAVRSLALPSRGEPGPRLAPQHQE